MKLDATDRAAIRRLVKKYVTAFNQQKARVCASVLDGPVTLAYRYAAA